MLDKKMAVVVVALTLLSAITVLGATNLIVNGSGIVNSGFPVTQKAPPEVELLIEPTGSPNILVITVANGYFFNGNVTSATGIDNSVEFLGTDSITNEQYTATAHKINLNTWTLNIKYQDGTELNLGVNGHLQITT